MHDLLWAGAKVKGEYALYHLTEMERALLPPDQTQMTAALESGHVVVDTRWRLRLFANLAACVSAVRSIPEVVNCCFGEDDGSKEMKAWLKRLPQDELTRRRRFSTQFEEYYGPFRDLPLSRARIDSDHRIGATAAEAKVRGYSGVSYMASAIESLPTAEAIIVGKTEAGPITLTRPLRPDHGDFVLDGHPLFPLCRNYVLQGQKLIEEGRRIAEQVHGSERLTSPPSMRVRELPT